MNHNRLSRPGNAISRESLLAMAESVDRAAHDLAQAYPEVIVELVFGDHALRGRQRT